MKSSNGTPRRGRQSARRQFDCGCRLAALRAITAARLHLKHGMALRSAVRACGSNIHYVVAAVTLLQSENVSLIERVLRGDVPILAAAREMRRLGALVAAYRQAGEADIDYLVANNPERFMQALDRYTQPQFSFAAE